MTRALDPTLEEMRAALALHFGPDAGTGSDVDAEAAIYWYAAENHAGQWSNLYSALSRSPYHPGMLERGPRDMAEEMCEHLALTFSAQPEEA